MSSNHRLMRFIGSVLLCSVAACGDGGAGAGSADASGSAAAKKSAAPSSKPAGSGAASATPSAAPSAAPAAGADLAVLGGADWKAPFAGDPPMKLPESLGGGQGTGMADDYTRKTASPEPPWKYNAAGGGGVYWAPSKKAVMVNNINLKADATTKTVDTWIKSALVSDVKHLGEGEIIEVGPDKIPLKAGAGTAKMKGGEAADFYWWDMYSTGDFSHTLTIVIVAKDAPEEDKKVALSTLRQVAYTPKAKPHYKK